MKTIQTLTIAVCSVALAACGGEPTEKVGGMQAGCATRAYANIGGPIDLVDHHGERVSEEDFKGAPTLVYFGFTYCPDVCPGTLVAIEKAYQQLPDGVAPPQTVLITVDPERDTPEALASYVATSAFPDNLVGLTGSPQQIRAAADAFAADYSRIEASESLAEYTMDHTSLLYLMDKDWTLKTFFAESDTNPEAMARCLAQQMSD
jgi:protein SCO1/2